MLGRTSFIVCVALVCLLLAPVVQAQAPAPSQAGIPLNAPAFARLLSTGSASSTAAALPLDLATLQAQAFSGSVLAWIVVGLLALALLYALAAAVVVALGRDVPALPARTRILIPILSVLGLGVALYLTYVETKNVAAVCGPVGDCNAVQSSPFAKLFGFLPVGLVGAIGYVAIVLAWILGRKPETTVGRVATLMVFGMALFGVLFSAYLTYLELYVIKAVCIWCLTSAVIMSLILALSVGPVVEVLSMEE